MSLLRQGKAQALTIYLGESDQWQGTPLYVAILQRLRDYGCAGATATRAVAGYGAGARLHESSVLHWSSDASIVIQVIDQPERLRRLLPELREMLNGGLMTLHEVEVLKYTHARRKGLPKKLTVGKVMETAVVTVQLETPAADIVTLLLESPFRTVPVLDAQRHLRGIISTTDLINANLLPVRRAMVRTALELDIQTVEAIEVPLEQARRSNLTAQDIMNRRVRSVGVDMSLRNAAQVMLENSLRRLPVVDKDMTLLGMLTRADLLQVVVTSPLMNAQASSGTQPLQLPATHATVPTQQRPIANYINSDVVTVTAQTPLNDVIDALITSPLKRIIVVDEQHRIQGIISDVDVLAHMQEELRPHFLSLLTRRGRGARTGSLRTTHNGAIVAYDVMNSNVTMVVETTSVQETIEKMLVAKRKFLPVISERGRLLGVVGRSDLLRILIEE